MSTNNFLINTGFGNYCYIESGEDSDILYDFEIENFNYLKERFEMQLDFFDITLKSGYYEGINIYIQPRNKDLNIDWMINGLKGLTNEESHYLFDLNRSTAIRKIKSEINKINKKILPYIAKNSNFRKFVKIGQFSTGEAIYNYI